LADNEVSLETHTIDLITVLLDQLDNSESTIELGAGVLDVVIIVVQLSTGVSCCSRCEGNGDVCFADSLVKDIATVCAVFVQSLVDDIPGVTFALVVANLICDMVFENVDERGIVKVPVGDPSRKLVVPDKIVATHNLAILLCNRNDSVASTVAELILVGLDGIPLSII
jgi:hypothetical protein